MHSCRTVFLRLCLLATIMSGLLAGCDDKQPESVADGDATTVTDTEASDTGEEDTGPPPPPKPPAPPSKFDKVDIIIVLDNSNSMAEEQAMLQQSLGTMIDALINPATINTPSTEDLRIAFVTSDMGLSWGGKPFDKDLDGFPPFMLNEACSPPLGDNGAFVDQYILEAPDTCPLSPLDHGMNYVTTTDEVWALDDVVPTAACLGGYIGVEGCGFEQQLTAGAVAMKNGQLDGFVRPDSLTVIIVISDEEDCSIENGPALFASEEIQNTALGEINIACGENKDALYQVQQLKDQFIAAKQTAGAEFPESSLMFAAIVGVPVVDECQGNGEEIQSCLELELSQGGTMRAPAKVERLQNYGSEATYYEFACERLDENNAPITQAYPGTRYVEMAMKFRTMGYVFSICNEDWTPAMLEISEMIASQLIVVE